MNNRDRETLKIYMLIFLFIYMTYTLIKSYNAESEQQVLKPRIKIRKKGIIGKLKDKIKVEKEIPSFYLEMNKLRNDFVDSLDSGNPKWNLILVIGEIYSRGIFPYVQADDILASSLYSIGSRCPCTDTSALSIAKLIDLRNNPLDSQDRMGKIIDASYAHSVTEKALEYINNLPDSSFKTKSLKPKPIIPENPNPFRDFNNINRVETNPPIVELPEEETVETDERLYNQSSHDSGVTVSTKSNIKKLKEDFPSDNTDDEIIEKAIELCNSVSNRNNELIGFSKENLSDAHEVIVSLSPIEYSKTGVTQVKILGKVLQKIDSIEDPEIKSNVEETLCKRLSSAVEKGQSVCATGKISRILSVFEGVDENAQKAVPIEMVKFEISQAASQIRDQYLEKLTPHQIQLYSSELSVPFYSEQMASQLKEKCENEYVKKLGIPRSVIDPLVKTYSEAF